MDICVVDRKICSDWLSLGVQGDNGVMRVRFMLQRPGALREESWLAYLLFRRQDGSAGAIRIPERDIEREGDRIILNWLVGREVTAQPGRLWIALKLSGAGEVLWHSELAQCTVARTIQAESPQQVLFAAGGARMADTGTEPAITIAERAIQIPAQLQNIAVQNDRNSETVRLIMPRYYDGHDLSRYSLYLKTILPNGGRDDIPLMPTVSANELTMPWTLAPPQTSYTGRLELQLYVAGEGFKWETEASAVHIIRSLDGKPVIPTTPTVMDTFIGQISALANAAKISETNAKGSQTAAKTSETNAKASETAALASKNAAAQSATGASGSAQGALNSLNSAKAEANRSKTEADRSKTEADRSKSEADRAAHAAGFDPADYYGAEEGTRLEREKANWDAGTQTGERFITLPPCESTTAAVKVYGSTAQQVSAQGKNLWGGTRRWPATNLGVTLDYDPVTDEYTANGTVTGRATLATISKIPFQAVKGQKITLSTYKVSGTMTGYIMPCAELLDAAGGLTPRALVEGWVMAEATSASFSYIVTDAAAENTTRLNMTIWLSDYLPTTFTDYRFKVQLEVGGKTAWERFTPQKPSPGFPAPMQGVGESGVLEVAVCGKNLLPMTAVTQTISGVTFTVGADKSITANGTAAATINLFLTPRIESYADSDVLLDGAVAWRAAEAFPAGVSVQVTTFKPDGSVRVVMNGTTAVCIKERLRNCLFYIESGTVMNKLIVRPMLNYGVAPLPYEPYHSQSVRIPLTAPLYSLPSGVRDTVDIESGTITRRIGKRTFTGEETFLVLSDGSASIARFSCKAAFVKKTMTEIIMQSSHFRPARLDSWGVEESVSAGEHTYNRIDFNFHKARLTGWSDSLTGAQKLALFKAWLTANPVTVLYELETPTEERIDPALLPVYANGTTLYSPDAVPPPLEATVLDPRPVSAARSLSGYAARQMESKADKSWVDSALEGKANNAPVDILPFSLDPRFIGTSTCVYWKNEFGEINVQIRCKSNGAISSPVNLGTLPVGFRPRFEVVGPAIIKTSSSGWVLSVVVLRTDGDVQLWTEVGDGILQDVIVSIGLIPT